MTVVVSIVGVVARLVSVIDRIGVRIVQSADDPLAPTDLDPDSARDIACDVTATGDICRILDPTDFQPPDLPTPSSPPAPGGGALGQLLVIVLVAAILIGVAWMVKQWLAGRPGKDDDDDDHDLDEDLGDALDARVIDHETPPERWRRLAREHRDAGDFREAIRCEYRALVGDLARAGFVDEIPGRTSGEERAQVADLAGHVSADFVVTADLFDEAWFNDDPVLAEHDERFATAERAVLDAVLAGSSRRRR